MWSIYIYIHNLLRLLLSIKTSVHYSSTLIPSRHVRPEQIGTPTDALLRPHCDPCRSGFMILSPELLLEQYIVVRC
jgi:hypothetical protein